MSQADIIQLLKEHKGLTANQISEKTGLHLTRVHVNLKKLRENQLVNWEIRDQETRKAVYVYYRKS